ncbi:MAG: PSD1 and planctomycete cytochrome C domain-containing protein [Planctomycetaceae bacterium]
MATADERAADHVARVKAGTEIFKASVRGILVERCLSCHGGEFPEGEFNLATREGLLKGGDKGVAVVPGKSAESRLFRMINHTEKPHMPYDEDQLPADQIAAIRQWIDLEAPYDQPLVDGDVELTDWTERTIDEDARRFWAFQPLANVQPPKVADDGWCRNDIDHFVLATQQQHKLQPNGTADRRTLIRRAYFGLIGLPPEPDELQRLMQDEASDWYDRMVDGLLDSPHFGERWARHWLDIARFAESHGFEQDYNRDFAYHYRDFVIKAFNSDMPYDQFVKWQLAGDEFAPDDPLALMATGFLGAGVFPTQLTEKEFEPARYDELDDMVSTMGTAMLGMTIGCARCHDHKFDPIPAADYYHLISTFGSTIRSNVEIDLAPDETRLALEKWQTDRRPLAAALSNFEQNQLPERFEAWLASDATKQQPSVANAEWSVLHISEMKSAGGATLTVQPDDSILATGTNPDFDTYTFTAETQLTDLRSLRLEALAHESMKRGGPGRADNGNMGLGTISVTAEPLSGDVKPVNVRLINPRATFEQNDSNLSIAASIDDKPKTGWAVDPQFGRDHAAAFEFAKPVGFDEGTRLTITLKFDVNDRHNIGRVRLSVSHSATPPALDAGSQPQAIAELALLAASGGRPANEAQQQKFLRSYRTLDPEWKVLSQRLARHDQAKPVPKLTTVMVSSEGVKPIPHHADGRGFPHFYKETFFLKRGDATQKVRTAEPGFLQVLTAADASQNRWNETPPDGCQTSYRRRNLANWMTDTDSGAGHLLARVIVNRLWQHHIGRGLVSTSNDFGKQGELPSHPELLDWLATRLIVEGWHLKPIHRLILQSATYRQSTDFDQQRSKVDPENRFLWRRKPKRLEAEVIRDSMLAVGHQLDRTQFGPGTLNEGQKRRSIYFMIKRSGLIPMMQIFDSPEPLASVGERPSTTIASQALMFMNSSHVRSYAGGFAQQVSASTNLVDQVYLRGLARLPTDEERASAELFLKSQSASYMTDGKTPVDGDRLALTDLCQTIFCLNEFVFVD